jgi:hypothetical protein
VGNERRHCAGVVAVGDAVLTVNKPVIVAFVLLFAASVGSSWLAGDKAAKAQRDMVFDTQVRLRDSQVQGCYRTIADRNDAIRGWKAARRARLMTAANPRVTMKERLEASGAAAVYKEVIESYQSRIVQCERAFPPVMR